MRVCPSGGAGAGAVTSGAGMPSAATLLIADVGFERGAEIERDRVERRSAEAVCDRQCRVALSVAGWSPRQRPSRCVFTGGNLRAAAAGGGAATGGLHDDCTHGDYYDGRGSGWSLAGWRGGYFRRVRATGEFRTPPSGGGGGGGGDFSALVSGSRSLFSRQSRLQDGVAFGPQRHRRGRDFDDAARASSMPFRDEEHHVGTRFRACGTPPDRESIDGTEHPAGREWTFSRGEVKEWPGERGEGDLAAVDGVQFGTQHDILHGYEGGGRREEAWTEEEEAGKGEATAAMTERVKDSQGVQERCFNQKYRPRKLREVVGQARVAEALSNALATDRIAPAYIFSGPRGTGKTSAARIFAAAINCLNPRSTGDGDRQREPCGRCSQCIGTLRGSNVDVREIDAATHNGVDSIRELLSSVRLSPVCSSVRYKVYVIDECHMLSSEAANALLKTLEEAPPMVVFILVTTDPQRLPATVLSRCLRFPFRRIGVQDIMTRLANVARREGVRVEEDALRLMAAHADGALRDGEAILEQMSLLQGSGGEVTAAIVREFLGVVGEEEVCELLASLVMADFFPERSLVRIRNLTENGAEPGAIVAQLAALVTDLLAARCEATGLGGREQSSWKTQAPHWKRDAEEVAGHGVGVMKDGLISLARTANGLLLLRQFLGKLSEVEKQVRAAGNPQLWLEVGLLSLVDSRTSQTSRNFLLSSPIFLEDSIRPLGGSDISVPDAAGSPLSARRSSADVPPGEGGGDDQSEHQEKGDGFRRSSMDPSVEWKRKEEEDEEEVERVKVGARRKVSGQRVLGEIDGDEGRGRLASRDCRASDVAPPEASGQEAMEASTSSLSSFPPSVSSSRGQLSSPALSIELGEAGAVNIEMDKQGRTGGVVNRNVEVEERSRTRSSLEVEEVIMASCLEKVGVEINGDDTRGARNGTTTGGEDALQQGPTQRSELTGTSGKRERNGKSGVSEPGRGGVAQEIDDEAVVEIPEAAEGEGDDAQEEDGGLPRDELWRQVIGKVKLKTVRTLLENRGRLECFSEDEACVLFTVTEFARRAEKNKHHIEAAFKKVCGSEVTVTIKNVAAQSENGNGNEHGGKRSLDASTRKQVRKARRSSELKAHELGGGNTDPGGDGVETRMSESIRLRQGRRPLTVRKKYNADVETRDEVVGTIGSRPVISDASSDEKGSHHVDDTVIPSSEGGKRSDEILKLEGEHGSSNAKAGASHPGSNVPKVMIEKQITGKGAFTMAQTSEEIEADCASEWEKETAKYTCGFDHHDGSEGPLQVNSVWTAEGSQGAMVIGSLTGKSGYRGDAEWEGGTERPMEYLMPENQETEDQKGGIGVLGNINTANMVRGRQGEEQFDTYEGKSGSALVIERVRRTRVEKKRGFLPRKLEAAESIAKVFNGIIVPF